MIVFLRCVAEAIIAKGVRGLASLAPGGEFLYDVSAETLRRWRERQQSQEDARCELEQLASASTADGKKAAQLLVEEVAVGATPEEREMLAQYLAQIPASVRASFRRPEDPIGTTTPADFRLDDSQNIAKLLPTQAPQFRIGNRLPNRSDWVLRRWLGVGGFGEVWLAANPITGRQAAVKFGTGLSSNQLMLFKHEAKLASAALRAHPHPGLVPLIDSELGCDPPWLMYEYVGGGDLSGLVLSSQKLPVADRVAIVVDALTQLNEAIIGLHRRQPSLVHRDLKPTNILIVPSKSRGGSTVLPRLRITDFGIGGIAVQQQVSMTKLGGPYTGHLPSMLRGAYSLLYASPQQRAGEAPDPRDDIHALGIIGYQMLTGRLDAEMKGNWQKSLKSQGVPEQLIDLIGDSTSENPDDRPASAAVFLTRLKTVPLQTPLDAVECIRFLCPRCQHLLSAPVTASGKRARCTRCPTQLIVPGEVVTLPQQPPKPIERAAPLAESATKTPIIYLDAGQRRGRDDRAEEGPPRRRKRRSQGRSLFVSLFQVGLILAFVIACLSVGMWYMLAIRTRSTPSSESYNPAPSRFETQDNPKYEAPPKSYDEPRKPEMKPAP